jgi:hypothetical protein
MNEVNPTDYPEIYSWVITIKNLHYNS